MIIKVFLLQSNALIIKWQHFTISIKILYPSNIIFPSNFCDGFAMLLGLTGAGNLLTLVGTGNTGVRGTGRGLCWGRLDKPKASNKLFVPWCHFPFPLVIQTINLESCRYEPLLRLGRQELKSHLITSSSWASFSQRGEDSVLFVSWTWHIDTGAGKRHFNRTSKEPGQRSGWGHNLLQNYLHTQLSVWALGRNHNRERRGLSSVVPITAGNLIKLHKQNTEQNINTAST